MFSLARQFGYTLVWAPVVAYAIYTVGYTFRAFAGQTSIANVALEIAGQLNVTVKVSVTLALTTSGLWLNEYRRHRKTRQRLTARITELELRLDPHRTSSNLTDEGTTQPGDL